MDVAIGPLQAENVVQEQDGAELVARDRRIRGEIRKERVNIRCMRYRHLSVKVLAINFLFVALKTLLDLAWYKHNDAAQSRILQIVPLALAITMGTFVICLEIARWCNANDMEPMDIYGCLRPRNQNDIFEFLAIGYISIIMSIIITASLFPCAMLMFEPKVWGIVRIRFTIVALMHNHILLSHRIYEILSEQEDPLDADENWMYDKVELITFLTMLNHFLFYYLILTWSDGPDYNSPNLFETILLFVMNKIK